MRKAAVRGRATGPQQSCGEAEVARTVADLGEIELVEHILGILGSEASSPEVVRVGPGDDAAVLACRGDVVLTTDSQHEGVHFRGDWIGPEQLGRRAIAVNASDLGAMGARPVGFLVALAVPQETELEWVSALARGLRDGAQCYGATIIGGDVAGVPGRVSINVTAVGERAASARAGRDGARVGHRIMVTGWPGRAAAGVSLLRAESEGATSAAQECLRAFRQPRPPVAFGVAVVEADLVAAMMDISDGIGIDLGRMCRASNVGASLDAGVLLADPVLTAAAAAAGVEALDYILGGGDDYELLCAVDEAKVDEFRAVALGHGVEARDIGRVVDAEDGVTLSVDGVPEPIGDGGWDHFS